MDKSLGPKEPSGALSGAPMEAFTKQGRRPARLGYSQSTPGSLQGCVGLQKRSMGSKIIMWGSIGLPQCFMGLQSCSTELQWSSIGPHGDYKGLCKAPGATSMVARSCSMRLHMAPTGCYIRLQYCSMGLLSSMGHHRAPVVLHGAPMLLHEVPWGVRKAPCSRGLHAGPTGPVGVAPMGLGSSPEPGLLLCA